MTLESLGSLTLVGEVELEGGQSRHTHVDEECSDSSGHSDDKGDDPLYNPPSPELLLPNDEQASLASPSQQRAPPWSMSGAVSG